MSRKKITLSVVYITILCLSLVAGATIDEGFEKLDSAKDQAERFKDAAAYNQTSSEFLVNQWSKTLEGTILGNVLKRVDSLLVALSPLFKVFLGKEYTLSWAFFLAFFMWGVMFVIIYRPLKELLSLQPWIPLILAIAATTLIAHTGVIDKSILFMTTLVSNIWILGIAAFITIIIAMIYSRLMRKMGKQIEEKRKKEREALREQKEKMIDVMKDVSIESRKLLK